MSTSPTDRLAVYGIPSESITLEDLTVAHHETVCLSGKVDKYAKNIKKIRPKDIDQLKSWIGVENQVANRISRPDGSFVGPNWATRARIPPGAAAVISERAVPETPEAKTPDKRELLQAIGKRFVYGDSAVSVQWKAQLNAAISNVQISVATYRNITIEENGTLILTPDIDVLHANDLLIKKNGKIVVEGNNVKLHLRSIKGEDSTIPSVIFPPRDTRPVLRPGGVIRP